MPHIWGGVETHVSEVNRVLKTDHHITVLTEQFESILPLQQKIDGITVIRLPHRAVGHKLATWKWLWTQRRVLLSADVIQVHDVFWWLLPLLPVVEDKVFTTFHGWETQYPVRWQAQLQRWWAAQLSRATVHVGEWIKEFYWDTPTAVTYGGTQVPETVSVFPQLTKSLKVVFIGRLSAENEISQYLKLLTQLQHSQFKIEMTWVGDGPLRDQCAKWGTVTGFTSAKPYLSKAHLVFASSYLSMLEAQAAGKVVVAFYSHLLKQRYLETYAGSEFVLISDQPAEVMNQLQKWRAEPAGYVKLQRQARKFATTQTWTQVAAMYEQLWSLIHV